MDGLLVVDKPVGPTSHDVVQRVRKAIGQRRIGHTGTLDPAASGVLPLVVGRATRLAWLLTAADKAYDAVVRLGFSTDTYDSAGQPVSPAHDGPMPAREAIERALDAFRGRFDQQPPAYSAKRIAGVRSYATARAGRLAGLTSLPAPAPVTVAAHRIEIVDLSGSLLTLAVECSAGFYVRSLAYDLGQRLGVGGHLASLRRTRSGDLTLSNAVPLEIVERDRGGTSDALIPLERMLPGLAALTLTPEGALRTRHGRDLAADHFSNQSTIVPERANASYRLFDPDGQLLAIAQATTPGLLHPSIVLV